MSEWFGVEPFGATMSVAHITKGSYGIPLLSITLLWQYHRFDINRLFSGQLLKQGDKKSEA